jgi:hypothetical protein
MTSPAEFFIPEEKLRVIIMKTGQYLMGHTQFTLRETGPTAPYIVIRDPVWVVSTGQVTNKMNKDVVLEEYNFRPFFNETADDNQVIVPDLVLSVITPERSLVHRYNQYIQQRNDVLDAYHLSFAVHLQKLDRQYVEDYLETHFPNHSQPNLDAPTEEDSYPK